MKKQFLLDDYQNENVIGFMLCCKNAQSTVIYGDDDYVRLSILILRSLVCILYF